uniref:Uncharacterized protein n=1 Tax=Arundo donax TaxID=35708 RepID=A0A0A9HQD1_ARUDO
MAPPLVLTLSGDSSSNAISDAQPKQQSAEQEECGKRGEDFKEGRGERREDEREEKEGEGGFGKGRG